MDLKRGTITYFGDFWADFRFYESEEKTKYPRIFVNTSASNEYVCHLVTKSKSNAFLIYSGNVFGGMSWHDETSLETLPDNVDNYNDWFIEMTEEEIVLRCGFIPSI